MLGFYEHLGKLEEAMHGNSESFSEAFFKAISLSALQTNDIAMNQILKS
jgi:hypothetical protein